MTTLCESCLQEIKNEEHVGKEHHYIVMGNGRRLRACIECYCEWDMHR